MHPVNKSTLVAHNGARLLPKKGGRASHSTTDLQFVEEIRQYLLLASRV